MYECRCPNDGKMLARLARPPLSELRYVHLCEGGRRMEGRAWYIYFFIEGEVQIDLEGDLC